MKSFVSAAVVAALAWSGSPSAEQSPAPAGTLGRGIYLEGAEAPDQLQATMTMESRTSGTMKAVFGGRPSIVLILSGTAGARRIATTEPSFRLVLTGSGMPKLDMANLESMAMNMNAPSPMAKQPKDFGIARLTVVDDSRELDLKKGRVALTVEKIEKDVYRLKPAKPLEPGEYTIFFEVGGTATGQLWDFGIDAAK